MVLQVRTHGIELEVLSILLLGGILLGNLEVAVGTSHILGIEGIATSEEGNLSGILLLGSLVHSCEIGISSRVGEHTPVLQHRGIVTLTGSFLSDVDEV